MIVYPKYEDIVTPALSVGAIHNTHMPGFVEDYLILHCMVRRYKPHRFFEVGTHQGTGTKIIANAMNYEGDIFSLDLPDDKKDVSAQHPLHHGLFVGGGCRARFFQLRGDSREYDFAQHKPLDGFYIDAEHIYPNVLIESGKAARCQPKFIVWHDCDVDQVWRAVQDAINEYNTGNGPKYVLHRVLPTRVGFALREDLVKQ